MKTIVRKDGTKLLVDNALQGCSRAVLLVSGYGYSTNHPLFYYTRNIAKQNSYDVISIDFDYKNNDAFLMLSPEEQDHYFDNDIKFLKSEIQELGYNETIFVGKSMGTTAINRFIESGLLKLKDKMVLITPGIEWKLIGERLSQIDNKALVIGSLADPKYTSIDLKRFHKLENVEFLEFKREDHGLEIGEYINDIKVILKIMQRINKFMKK